MGWIILNQLNYENVLTNTFTTEYKKINFIFSSFWASACLDKPR